MAMIAQPTPLQTRPAETLQTFLQRGGLTTHALDKLLLTQSLDQLITQNPKISDLLKAYFKLAKERLNVLENRMDEPSKRALYANVDIPDLKFFETYEIKGTLGEQWVSKQMFEQPRDYWKALGFTEKQADAVKTLFSDEGIKSTGYKGYENQVTQSQYQKILNEVIEAEYHYEGDSHGQGQQGGQQEGQEQQQGQAGPGFGKQMKEEGVGSTQGSFSKQMGSSAGGFNKSFGLPTPPPGFGPPPSGSPGTGFYPGTTNQELRKIVNQTLQGTGVEGLFDYLFDESDKATSVYTDIITQLDKVRSAKAQIMLELGNIDPTTPEGRHKVTQIQYKLQDINTSERELMDFMLAAQNSQSEMVKFLSTAMDTLYKTLENIVRSFRSN